MSYAWQTTPDDIWTVLKAHGWTDESEADRIYDEWGSEFDRIVKAVLRCTGMDNQTASALDEIEDILIEQKSIEGPKKFKAP